MMYSLTFVYADVGQFALLTFLLVLLIYCLVSGAKGKNYPPGPIGLPFVGYSPFLGEKPQDTLLELSKKYGNIMGIQLGRRHTIVVSEYEVFKEAVCHPAALNRSPNLFLHLLGLGFVDANGLEWQEQRRYFMHLMRDVGMARGNWNNILREAADAFVKELLCSNGRPTVDFTKRLNKSTNSNILHLLFGGKSHKDFDDDMVKLFQEYAETALVYTGPAKLATQIPIIRKLLEYFEIAGYEKSASASTRVSEFVKNEIAKRKKFPDSYDDDDAIINYIKKMKQLESQSVEHFFSDYNLEGNVKALFLGGSDTVFSALTWAIRLMAGHQDVQKKVHAELDEVIGKDGFITYEERHKVPYTFATIMESQRVSTIVPLSSTRWVSEEFQLRGYTIPKGAEIVGNTWAIHNDPNYFDNPSSFNPHRYLSENGTKIEKNPPGYIVFSLGRRNCPGETVAWTTIMVYFCAIMQRFHITPASPGDEVKYDCIQGLVIQLKPQPLCFKDRS